jgi:hypothetical protein
MHPGNLVPVSYILNVLDYTSTLYTIMYSYDNYSRACHERRQGELLNSLVYIYDFPGIFLHGKNLAKIASALKFVGSFSASTETSGFRLKSQTRVNINTCFLPSHYVGSLPYIVLVCVPLPFPLEEGF